MATYYEMETYRARSLLWSSPGADFKKTSVIFYGGILWALGFLLPLFPWSETNDTLKGMHFIFALCFCTSLATLVFRSDRPDDGALTVTSLAHSSLLADLAVTTAKRSQWNKYAAWFGVAGANSIVLRYAQAMLPSACEWLTYLHCSQLIGNGRNLPAFRVLGFILSAVACALFYATAKHLEPLEAQTRRSLSATHSDEDLRLDVSTWTLSKQLLHRNFLIYCLIGIIQVFNCHFNSNLLALVLARVFDSSAFVQTAVLFGSAVLPQLCVALLADTVVSRGLFTVVSGLLLAKTGVALLNSMFGDPGAMMLAALFLLANKVVTEVRASLGERARGD